MYANLRVAVARKPAKLLPDRQFVADELLSAWRVRTLGAKVLVYLDRDDDSERPHRAGLRTFDLADYHVDIRADY